VNAYNGLHDTFSSSKLKHPPSKLQILCQTKADRIKMITIILNLVLPSQEVYCNLMSKTSTKKNISAFMV